MKTALVCLVLCGGVVAQAPTPAPVAQDGQDRAAQEKTAAAKRALQAWLESDLTDATLLDKATKAILAAEPSLLTEVAARAQAAQKADDRQVGRGLDSVIRHVTLAIVQREAESGMVYEGQYEVLRGLQPFAGKLLLQLLLDPPDWFDSQQRPGLIAPLRDVLPQSPGADVLEQLREIASDEQFESSALRQSLPFLLAQWGDRALIDARIASVKAEVDDPNTKGERRAAQRYELADIYYTLRDYARAARIHVDMLRQAEADGVELQPNQYYNAACCLARSGAGDAALAELERAAKLMASGRVDRSQMIERKLFDRDPDLASVRGHARFAALVRVAFGEPAGKSGEARKQD